MAPLKKGDTQNLNRFDNVMVVEATTTRRLALAGVAVNKGVSITVHNNDNNAATTTSFDAGGSRHNI